MLEMADADKNNRVPPQFMKSYEEVGSSTWTESMLNSTVIMTVDPKNVQAVLATKFRDFELGPQRRNNFSAMLGTGIFTADGKIWLVLTDVLACATSHLLKVSIGNTLGRC